MGRKAADSDIRMMIATQVSYLDGKPGVMAGDLVARTIAAYAEEDNLPERERKQLETARYVQSQIEKHRLNDCCRWVIREIDDDNTKSGFYGCLIDTRDGGSIVGMRGSESFDRKQVLHDWVEADAGLMNSTETRQQCRAAEFARHLYHVYGAAYDGYSFAGHSLGGNLAEHAAVTAPAGMSIRRCVNLDGPGFSGEYIDLHRNDIAQRCRYIDHYQYSLVGTLLTPLPGTNYQTIAAHNDKDSKGLSAFIVRHHTRNIEFNGNGQVKPGKRDAVSMITDPLSKDLDAMDFSPLWLVCPQLVLMQAVTREGCAALLSIKTQAGRMLGSAKGTLRGGGGTDGEMALLPSKALNAIGGMGCTPSDNKARQDVFTRWHFSRELVKKRRHGI